MPSNMLDEFRCYSARDGTVMWTRSYPAAGQLDYDNMPRATPLIHDGRVYLLGAFGDLSCVKLESGQIQWQMNLLKLFNGDQELVWGTCSSPLVVDGKLIVNPGGPAASLVALDPKTAGFIWQSPGDRHAYSFVHRGDARRGAANRRLRSHFAWRLGYRDRAIGCGRSSRRTTATSTSPRP